MAYSIHGPISYRQKIELGLLGSSAIKPRCSVYSSPCPEYVGTNLSFGRNYWGKYGHFVLFAIRVNKSVAIVFLITCFLQHARMYSISTLSKFQVIYPKRSWVIPLQSFLKDTFDFMLQDSHQTENKDLTNIRGIIKVNDLLNVLSSYVNEQVCVLYINSIVNVIRGLRNKILHKRIKINWYIILYMRNYSNASTPVTINQYMRCPFI